MEDGHCEAVESRAEDVLGGPGHSCMPGTAKTSRPTITLSQGGNWTKTQL
jgi:hypothetical protein